MQRSPKVMAPQLALKSHVPRPRQRRDEVLMSSDGVEFDTHVPSPVHLSDKGELHIKGAANTKGATNNTKPSKTANRATLTYSSSRGSDWEQTHIGKKSSNVEGRVLRPRKPKDEARPTYKGVGAAGSGEDSEWGKRKVATKWDVPGRPGTSRYEFRNRETAPNKSVRPTPEQDNPGGKEQKKTSRGRGLGHEKKP